MPFTSLEARIGTAPIIICGPILRRVEKDSVTVWFVSKQELTNVVLEVTDTNGITLLTSPASQTIKLGEFVHALALTATPSSGTVLSRGTTYLYDVSFGSLSAQRFSSPGILAATSVEFETNFCYLPHSLPSFVLPSDVPNLKIVHGSCRKPHGGETDAFRGVDTMLESTIDTPQRPQMLLLTGDQIYADDVSDTLLFMLMDASESLLKWGVGPSYEEEAIPGNPAADAIRPGNRQTIIAAAPDESHPNQLSSGYAKSHLITLGEFYSMYLFAWSDVLWPSESNFPTFEEVFPGMPRANEDWLLDMARAVAPEGMVPSGGVRTEEYQHYLTETAALKFYVKSLQFVRRAMANIATYMMFDDHEITDDWFLTREWVQNTLVTGSFTRRILQNGMAAYAVFQGWGNTPQTFESGNGAQLLALLSSLTTGTGNQTTIFNNIGTKVLPSLQSGNTRLSGSAIDWHFTIEFDDFRLVVLDTRNQRGYYSDDGFPALIAVSALSGQMPAPSSDKLVTILLSPAPVFGDIKIDDLQRLARIQGMYTKDQEAWVFNPDAYHAFLTHMSSYEKVVCLSGDVHYTFSVAIKYWNDTGSGVPRASFAQLCCSSLKNSDNGTNSTDSWFLRPPSTSVDYLTWGTDGFHYRDRGPGIVGPMVDKYIRANEPLRFDDLPSARLISNAAHQPQSRYRLNYIRDQRSSSARPAPVSSSSGGSTAQQSAGFVQRNRAENGHRTVVGRDNIGVISFDWPNNKVKHTLWLVPEGLTPAGVNTTLLQSYTIHDVSLALASSSDPRPGD